MSSAKHCPFCNRDPGRVLAEDDLTVMYKDGFPVSPGHTVILPKRHVATINDLLQAGVLLPDNTGYYLWKS